MAKRCVFQKGIRQTEGGNERGLTNRWKDIGKTHKYGYTKGKTKDDGMIKRR